jgi:hypothetical protein
VLAGADLVEEPGQVCGKSGKSGNASKAGKAGKAGKDSAARVLAV